MKTKIIYLIALFTYIASFISAYLGENHEMGYFIFWYFYIGAIAVPIIFGLFSKDKKKLVILLFIWFLLLKLHPVLLNIVIGWNIGLSIFSTTEAIMLILICSLGMTTFVIRHYLIKKLTN
jgi:hypothetical protein